jgi:maleylacetoacetate isomerase
MSSHALTLYTYWRSSSAYRVRLALAAKGLAYDAIYVNLLEGAQLKDEYRKASPMGHVPCLVIDGEAFVESVAIIELLDEMFPTPPLFPKDARARAHVRALIEMMNAGIQPLQNMAVIKKLSDDNDVRAEWIRHWIMRGFAALESLMQHHAEHACVESTPTAIRSPRPIFSSSRRCLMHADTSSISRRIRASLRRQIRRLRSKRCMSPSPSGNRTRSRRARR